MLALVLVLCGGAICAFAQPASTPRSAETEFVYTGRGVYVGDTTVAYTEYYVLRLREGEPVQVRTSYRERNGTLRAERTLDFGPGREAWRPGYRFRDRLTGYEEGADSRSPAQASTVIIRAFMRKKTGAPLREKTLHVPAPAVVDGGFVPFVRAHWDTLMAGARVPFHFVAVSRLDWFALELFRDAGADHEGRVAFVAQARHAALRLVVAPTRVWFDPATRRMAEFRGRSSLHDAESDPKMVRLVYSNMRPAQAVAAPP